MSERTESLALTFEEEATLLLVKARLDPLSTMAMKKMTKKQRDACQVLLVRAKIDPASVIAQEDVWCEILNPAGTFVCSRKRGHKGPHIAMYLDGGPTGRGENDDNPAVCADCDEPNPWIY